MNKRVAKKQVISFMLALALILSGIMFPVNKAQAAEAGIVYYDWDESSKQLIQKTIPEENCTVVTEDTTEWIGAEGGSWYIVNESIEIAERIKVEGEVHLILADGIEFKANSGINVSEDENIENSLSIYSQSLDEANMGSIEAETTTVEGWRRDSAIGADNEKNAGTITINGGKIKPNSDYGAAIGGGYNGNGGIITINGGIIDTYVHYGAVIGGGYNGNGGIITINGGIINAEASYGAGIGGGCNGNGDIININGGIINIESYYGASIGGGCNKDKIDDKNYANGGNITINGGTVNAIGALGAAIGGGWYGNGGTITINGGVVNADNTFYGAAIGGGYIGNAETTIINGGKISATASHGAGIGGGWKRELVGGDGGIITINGGEVIASSLSGAGIGGGSQGNVEEITISNGNITAESSTGAGIGGGENGNTENIIIEGGIINSYGGDGAGIGGGWNTNNSYQNGIAENITIKAGKITAKSYQGAGIGAGREGYGGNISLEGGEIISESEYGAGIGGANLTCIESITVSDGYINAKSEYGAGIGGGQSAKAGIVTIKGGIITAKSSGGAGIGNGYGSGYASLGNDEINIEAGTIIAESSSGAGIGAGFSSYSGIISIIGGNIKATSENGDRIGNGQHRTDENSDRYKYIRTITLCGMTEQTPIDSAVGIGNYGLTDVLTLDDNKLYFYLPTSTDMSSVTADGTLYIGRFEKGASEALFHNCTYTKDENENKIIATCTTENCVRYEISIAKPADTTYTGKAIEAQVTVNPENSFVPEVTYVANTGSLTDGKPVNAGNYTASITLGEETISVTYDITKTGASAEMPSSSMKVTCDKKVVKDIELPTDWSWSSKDASKTITVGKNTTATAVYTGSDKGYYETEEVKVTITSEHTGKTEVKDAKEATYDAEGYTGDTYCKDCGTMLTKGEKVAKLVKSAVDVKYTTHVQSYGWQDEVKNGAMSGTSGEAKRLEGIVISVDSDDDLGIQYTTHCQTYGWLPWVSNGDMSGTTGEAKRLEAIMIKLTGADAQYYDVYYRVHAQSYGWLNWAKNGEPSGTAGYGKRLEGIQIVVVKKGEAIDEKLGGIVSTNDKAYIATEGKSPIYDGTTTDNTNPVVGGNDLPTVKYRTHVQSYGWLNYEYNGCMSGTSGEAKRLEGIDIDVSNTNMSGDIVYTTHAQSYGWQSDLNDKTKWFKNGQIAGTLGEAKRLEAICIDLTGELKENYDIYYRVHIQSYGWLDWACNGAPSGSEGLAKRLEGIQIVIVPKGSGKPAASYMGITTASDKSYIK